MNAKDALAYTWSAAAQDHISWVWVYDEGIISIGNLALRFPSISSLKYGCVDGKGRPRYCQLSDLPPGESTDFACTPFKVQSVRWLAEE